MGGRPGPGVVQGPTRPASPSGRPWLPGPALTHLACAAVAGGGEGVAGGQPGRGQQAGPSPAWLRGRGTSLGHTGRDRPGVLTPSPGLLLPRDRMLDVQAGRVDRARSSWGRKGHVPGVGLLGERGRLQVAFGASGLAGGIPGASGAQLSLPQSPVLGRGHVNPGGCLSAWLPHELSALPARSRNPFP